jgi:TonB-linked SusC/RagA family outer membrane protein
MKKLRWIMMIVFVILYIQNTVAQDSSSASQEANMLSSMAVKASEQNSDQVLLSDFLSTLEKHFDVTFLYKNEMMKNKYIHKDDIPIGEQTGQELSRILDRLGIVFQKIDEQAYVLLAKTKSLADKQIQEEISGTVTDAQSGETLPGVNILVKGITTGVSTGPEGNFELTVPSLQDTLVVSFIGYQTKEVPINGRTELDIPLQPQAIQGEEMIVVGYGTQTERNVTGSISSVSTDKITQAPTATIGNALSGKLPGLQTIQRSGQPGGDAPEIYLRGISSLSTGRSQPIFVVDGVIQQNAQAIHQLDPNNIESVSVLKDASATAVYGIEGANGVIVVETKRGTRGETQISINTSSGFQSPTYVTELANSYNTARAYNEAQLNDGVSPDQLTFSQEALEAFRTGSDPLIYPDTDWVDYLTKPASFQSRTNVNVSGGTDNVRYYLAGGFLIQDGFFKTFESDYDFNPSFDRYNFRSNIDIDVTDKTTISLTAGGRIGKRVQINHLFGDLWYQIYRAPPYSSAGIVDGKLIDSGSGNYGSNQYIPMFTENLARRIYGQGYRENTNNVLNLNLSGKQELDFITQGLEAQLKGSYNIYFTRNKVRNSSIATYQPYYRTDVDPTAQGDSTVVFRKNGSDNTLGYSESYNKDRDWYIEGRLNYERGFGKHNFEGLLLYNQRKKYYPTEYTGIARSLVSTVGRINYNYDERYLGEVSLGYNGSENFAEGRRFGLFPAASVGWILTNEPYMPDIPFINHLKLRASYGVVGNDSGIGRFLYLANQYNTFTEGYNFGVEVPQNRPITAEGRIGNPELTWERSEKQNYGLDMRVFNNKLDLSVDYFHEFRSNILTTLNNVPTYVSADLPAVNIGEVKNQGYEIEVNWSDQVGDFSYEVGGNLSYSHNEIIYMDEIPRSEPYQRKTGHPVGQPDGYVFDRYYESSDFENDGTLESQFPQPNYQPQPGDLKYKDINGDGVINSDDRRTIGYPEYPEYTMGANFSFEFKNIDLSMQWAGAENVTRTFAFTPYRVPFGGNGQLGIAKYMWEERWTPEKGQNAGYPRLSIEANGRRNSSNSDYWQKDASYLRLKNIEIGYNFSPSLLEGIGLNNMRIYVSGYNLLTFTDLKAVDPEQSGNPQNSSYPVMKVYNFGLNVDL